MCLSVVVRQTPNGPVQERSVPARPIPPKNVSSMLTNQEANAPEKQTWDRQSDAIDDYTDPFAGLSLSSATSDKPKERTPVKQHGVCQHSITIPTQ